MLPFVKHPEETSLGTRQRDTLDRNLIASLERDAREPIASLARRLGVARTTITERISKLERDGVIRGYAAIISPDPDKQSLRAMVMISCQRPRLGGIIHQLQRFPEINDCVSITGPHNLMCRVEVPLAEDLDALADEISTMDGVDSVETTIVLATKFEAMVRQRPKADLKVVQA